MWDTTWKMFLYDEIQHRIIFPLLWDTMRKKFLVLGYNVNYYMALYPTPRNILYCKNCEIIVFFFSLRASLLWQYLSQIPLVVIKKHSKGLRKIFKLRGYLWESKKIFCVEYQTAVSIFKSLKFEHFGKYKKEIKST